MKISLLIAAVCMYAGSAFAAPPSNDSVRLLYRLMKADALIDSMYENMRANTAQMRQQIDPGNRMNAEQRKALDIAIERSVDLVKEEFTSEKLQKQFVVIYSESFTQEEIDGLTVFYSSPIGQSFISKMPAVTQKYMASAQSQMQTLLPRILKIIEAAVKSGK